MEAHEIWLTRLFNDKLAGLGNSLLGILGLPSQDRPWANFITMQILVALGSLRGRGKAAQAFARRPETATVR